MVCVLRETVSKLFGLTGTRVWTSSPIQYTCPTLARWTPTSTRCNTKPGVAIPRSERLPLRETPRQGEVRNDRQNSTAELKSINLSPPTCTEHFVFIYFHICLSRCGSNSIVSQSISGSPNRRMDCCLRGCCLCCLIHDLGTYSCLLFNIALDILEILLLWFFFNG